MKKTARFVLILLSAILAGFYGFATAAGWPVSTQPAAVQVDVDLTSQADPEMEDVVKIQETEPEEVPSLGDIEVEIVTREREQGTPLRVLIYHTHTYEAYEPVYNGQYKPTERWRTADSSYNVVRVGTELARILREEYGMVVVHDETAYEPPNLDDAYQRSLEAIENYTARGETFDLYLDLHRDAYVDGLFKNNTVVVDDQKVARIMFLIGKGSGTHNGQAFAQQPDWESNYARANSITQAINAIVDTNLCRPVSTSKSRYNQHVSTGALLVEIGNNMNSLEEALRAIPYLAQAIAETAGGTLEDIQHLVVEE